MTEYQMALTEWLSATDAFNAMDEPESGPIRDRLIAAAQRFRRAQRPEATSDEDQPPSRVDLDRPIRSATIAARDPSHSPQPGRPASVWSNDQEELMLESAESRTAPFPPDRLSDNAFRG